MGRFWFESFAVKIVDTYALSPLQQGMLYHSLYAPQSGVDMEQLVFRVAGGLDGEAFARAWRRVGERHAVLRTRFRWEGLSAPVQDVLDDAAVSFEVFECGDAPVGERDAQVEAFLRSDRARGFASLSDAPLWRVACFQWDDGAATVVWTFHHILLDGRSLPVLLHELFACYDAFRRGAKPDGEASPRPYRAFINWLGARNHDTSEAFWREMLGGFRAATPLGVDGLGDTAGAGAGHAARSVILSPLLTKSLRALAEAEKVTLNTVVSAAWAVLLARYSGEDDVVWGATRACRYGTVEGASEIAGLFINTLPVRAMAGGDSTVAELLRDLRAQHLAVRPHEHTPLTKAQGWSDVPRGGLLFDSLVVFENYEMDAAFAGNPAGAFDFELHEQTNFPLTLAAYAGTASLRLRIDYDRARFSDATITRLLGHLETLLGGMATSPRDTLLADLKMLPGSERRELLALAVPADAATFPDCRCLHHRFEERAVETPDAVAVVFGDDRLTYNELNVRANRLAHRLIGMGVGPETLVGLLAERSAGLIVGLLAILKAGGAYLPIDTAYPEARAAFMLHDARAPVLVTERNLPRTLSSDSDIAPQTVFLEDDFSDESAENPASDVTPDNAAYVIYTSGSTGNPKGVVVTHRNVDRLFLATDADFTFGRQDVWTLFHSHAFDFSVWEIWGAFLYGGRLVVVPYLVSRAPDEFHALLRREAVTVLNQTPSAFRTLIEADSNYATSASESGLALRLVIFGGEALDLGALKPWFDWHGDTAPQLVNMYGITETTVHVTYRPLTSADAESGTASVIGEPLRDLRLYVLDEKREPVPVGVAGEMYVGGAGLARGYLRRAELTGERFIPDPFGDSDGERETRLYRTGDRARRLPGGEIAYLGRTDHQVKIRGFRIELGEIEAALGGVPGVRAGVVVKREDAPGDERLVAYAVTEGGAPLPIPDLRRRLQQSLPSYMVPAAFVFLPALPLTSNGKLDKKALPAPPVFVFAASTATNETEGGAPPPESLEAALKTIWQNVLQQNRIGLHDNVFDLGAHSLLLVAVHSQLRSVLGEETPIVKLFQYPTISTLAHYLRENACESSPSPSVGGRAQERANRQRDAFTRQKILRKR